MKQEVQDFLNSLTPIEWIALKFFLSIEGAKLTALINSMEETLDDIIKNDNKIKVLNDMYIQLTLQERGMGDDTQSNVSNSAKTDSR